MINKISETTKQNTIRKSVKNVPTQPSALGITEQQLKNRFAGIVTDPTNSAYAEIDRVVDEANEEFRERDIALQTHIENEQIHAPNAIEKILVNGAEKQPDASKAVDITAEDLGAGAPNGLAQLDANQKLLTDQLPDGINRIERILVNNVEKAPYTDEVTGEKTVNITAEDLGAGAPNGLAQLDANQKLLTDQLPDGINVYEYYDSFDDFPETGESGVTYVDTTNNHVYLWTGTNYTSITAQLALGETSSTAYRGDRGKIAYDHSQSTGNPHQTEFEDILEKPTTLDGYGITDALKKGDQPKVVNDAFVLRITATNDVEILDSPLGTKTAEIKSIKGMSVKAIQKNGNFDGMTGWTQQYVTATTANGIATFTVTELSESSGFIGDATQQNSIAGHKYYLSVWIKAKYARSVRMGFTSGMVTATATANQWVLILGIVTPTESGDSQFFYHDCSAEYVIGDTFQVRDFRCIDLTDSGMTDWSKEKLDATIPYLEYWEGVRHSNPTQLKSIGDNLFDLQGGEFTTQNAEYRLLDTGFIVETEIAGGSASYINCWYKLCPNTQYILRWEAETFGGSENVVAHWDSSDYVRSYRVNQSTMTVNTDDTGTGRFFFYSKTGTPDAIYKTKYENILLQHAVNPNTDYKPYTEYVLELPQYTLRSLPDGTADEITPTHYIQRIDPETMTVLEEPIYTPIEWDNTYPAWNYGLEQVFDADGNLTIAQMEIEYPLDIVKQVETNTWVAQRNISAEKITSGVFDVARIPDLSAEKITSGTLSANRLPNLHTSKITAGVFDAERIPHNNILYGGTHDFLEDGDFYPPNFEFEIGSTYALEIELLNGVKTVIFTFVPNSYGNVELSFVSLYNVLEDYVTLDAGRLTARANRIIMGSTTRIRLYHENDDIERSTLYLLRLKKVTKLY
jgi:hypothetical protein